jgi:hypothetical protein
MRFQFETELNKNIWSLGVVVECSEDVGSIYFRNVGTYIKGYKVSIGNEILISRNVIILTDEIS